MQKGILFLLVIAVMSTSCVKDYYLDAGERPKVVVECILTEDPVQELFFSYDGGGKWTLDYSAVPSHTYRLEVKIPHYDLIMAETTMPEVPGVWCNHHMSGFYSYDELNEEGKKR